MQDIKTLKLGYFLFVIALIALFITTILADDSVSTGATLGAVGLVFFGFSYLRSERHRNNYPLDNLIKRDGDTMVLQQITGLDSEPLRIGVDDIYALNFSYHYLGVIISGNGRGYDLSYPYKEEELKAHLRTVIGEDAFGKIKINV